MTNWADHGFDPADLEGRDGNVKVACPQCRDQHRDGRKDCSVHVGRGIWRCHACDFRGALSGRWVEEHATRSYQRPVDKIREEMTPGAVAWFRARGIDEATIKKNGVGLESRWSFETKGFVPTVLFPYRRDGELVNYKARRLAVKEFTMAPQAERILYRLDHVGPETIIVEGEIDVMSLHVCGFDRVVSVPNGAPASNARGYATLFDFLEADAERLEIVETWVLAVDSDGPGKKLEAELARRFGPERCKRANWPDGCKDANDVLLKHGAEALRACVESAKPYPIDGLFCLEDFEDLLDAMRVHGPTRGVSPGWDILANLYTIRPGEWTLVTGVPSHGKSTFLDALFAHLLTQHRWRLAICSPENQPLQRHAAGLAEKLAGKPFSGYDAMDEAGYQAAKRVLRDQVVWILPDEPTLGAVLDRAKAAVLRRGVMGVAIDPWNELSVHRPNNMSETDHISQSLTEIRRFARDKGVHIWLVAHPTKPQRGKAGEKPPVVTPYDVSGAAHWYNKADNCITVHRDPEGVSNVVEVHVQKIRFREVGQKGVARFRYDHSCGRFEPLDWEILGKVLKPTAPQAPFVPGRDDPQDRYQDDEPTTPRGDRKAAEDDLFSRALASQDDQEGDF